MLFSHYDSVTPDERNPNVTSTSTVTRGRIQPLDVLRGIAVLGGLLVSVWMFGGFTENRQVQLFEYPHGYNYKLFSIIVLLFQGKMLALISLVFGAGIVLYLSKSNKQSNLAVPDLYIRRQMWLLAFGLLNALLFLWSQDVLFHLAIMGILLFPFARLSSKGLFIAAMVATAIFCGKNYWKYADDKKAYNKYLAVTAIEKKLSRDSLARAHAMQTKDGKNSAAVVAVKKDSLSKQQKADKMAWEMTLKNMKYDPKKDEGEYKEMQTLSFGDIWTHVLPATQSRESQWTYQTGVWDIASMMLLGMALLKFGFFEDRLPKNQYFFIAIAGLAAGLFLGWLRLHYNNIALRDYVKYIVRYPLPYNFSFPFEKLLLAVAYASGVMFLIRVTRLAAIWKALAAVGRLALTNYLLQSVFCTLFFTGYGMGYFGKLQQYELYFFAGEVWIVQIVFSWFWLQEFEYGPAEWLWRCMTYGKWLPIKNNTVDNIDTIIPALS
jgi:uncharacterized protein